MLGLLIRQRVTVFWNRLTRGPRAWQRLLGASLATIFTIGFVAFAGLNAGAFVERIQRVDPFAARSALPLIMAAVLALTLVTSLSSAFHHLYLAGDVELLLAAPIGARSLFWLKILEIWRDAVHVLIFQAAALIGLGLHLRLPVWYYPAALAMGVLFTLAAAAIGASMTLVLARVRLGEPVLAASRLLGVLLFVPIGILGIPSLGLGRGRLSPVLGQDGIESAADALQAAGPPPDWAPTTWAAHVLYGDEAAGLSMLLLVAAAAVVVLLTQLAFDSSFQVGYERVRFAGPARSAARSRPRHARTFGGGLVLGMIQKDWRVLLRDPRWRTGALVSLLALGLPAFVLFSSDPFTRATPAVRFWLGMLPVPYLAYLIGSQHGAATLAYEGRNIALLRAAPIGLSRILAAKILGGLTLVLGVTWLATLGLALARSGQPGEILLALGAASWLALGATMAAVAGAALTIDFEGDNPQRRVGCLGTIVIGCLSLFFFIANTALLGWWVARAILSVPRGLAAVAPVLDWTLPVMAGLSVVLILVASRLGWRRLAAWESS